MKWLQHLFIMFILLFSTYVTASADRYTSSTNTICWIEKISRDVVEGDVELPPPVFTSVLLEETIAKRRSVREFQTKDITSEELSTLLWAAYRNENGSWSVESFDGRHVIVVYVLTKDGVYTYDPQHHTLLQFRKFDARLIGLYDTASIKIGLVWDTHRCSDQNVAAAEIGMIGQNIYLMANALGLGTVTTAQKTKQLYLLGLPQGHKPLIIMPVGYPVEEEDFTYDAYETQLPFPQSNTLTFSQAVLQKTSWTYLTGDLNQLQLSQLLWSAYGYSYYQDNLQNRRHRSVPSSHGTYPLEILFFNTSAGYHYHPENHSLHQILDSDIRNEIAQYSMPWIPNADLFLITLNKSKSNTSWAWYYEAGAIWNNVLLEATALNLSANIIITFDRQQITTLFPNLNIELIAFIQVGIKNGEDTEPPTITINAPTKNQLYFMGTPLSSFPLTTIIGHFQTNITVEDESLRLVEYSINGKVFTENYWTPYIATLPISLLKKSHLKIIASDYFGNHASDEIEFLKIF